MDTMILARAKSNLRVGGYNIKTRTGRKGSKPRNISEGDIFVVVRKFMSTGMATHGDRCLELRDMPRFLAVREDDFETVEVPLSPYFEIEYGWDKGGNCKRCYEAGRCSCVHRVRVDVLKKIYDQARPK